MATSEVDNYGIVTGDVVLVDSGGDPAGTFTNHAGALFNAGTQVDANLVTNDGVIAPGGRGAILPTLRRSSAATSSRTRAASTPSTSTLRQAAP